MKLNDILFLFEANLELKTFWRGEKILFLVQMILYFYLKSNDIIFLFEANLELKLFGEEKNFLFLFQMILYNFI